MVAATITTNLEAHDPMRETVLLEVSDGETYTSKKFGSILAAHATGNADVDAHLNVTFSGAVATINYAGQTDKAVTLTLFGLK
jgi:hypothetical protein